MADEIKEEVVEKPRATHDELAAYMAAHKPPEEIVVEVQFGEGEEARTTEFHCRRSMLAFSRYMKDAYGPGGNPVAAALQFLVDSTVPAEQATMTAFAEQYPVDAVNAAHALESTYVTGDVEAGLKNGSRPAGP